MTNEQKQVKEWMAAFGQETPEKPIVPSLEVRKLRAKLILEECLETVEALGFGVNVNTIHKEQNLIEMEGFDYAPEEEIIVAIADGLEDIKVVTEGTLVACGLCQTKKIKYIAKELLGDHLGALELSEEREAESIIDPLFDEVMRSNWSKFWTRDEVQKEFNGDIGVFQLNETKRFEDCDVTFLGKESAFKERCYLVKNEAGKVLKSPSYSPANLQPIIDSL